MVFREEIKKFREAGGKKEFPEVRKGLFKIGIMVQE